MQSPIITFSTCFYILKSKFDPSVYISWMNHFLSIVNHFNLVIYCDETSLQYIKTNPHVIANPMIRVIVKPIDQFYTYRYREKWIQNHAKNTLLNQVSCWELNMLWSEKVFLVKETMEKRVFDTEFYGWCDIGYFRNRPQDTHTKNMTQWCANEATIKLIATHKIAYACICNDDGFMNYLHRLVHDVVKETGLPKTPIPPHQNSIAGGFFIAHRSNVGWWADTYDKQLSLYFQHGYLVKDDQLVLVNCILNQLERFQLFRENDVNKDNWFMFQRILCK